ncbi:MAG: hypothetical protein MUC35_00200 [Candidatus Margulisbacteria bacterium]|jgi:hypothetical protein|nr:hypothetical protein [Candidatus Margulisiibacteriota bacterium]
MEEVKYSKAEIISRVTWANHFRIIFGSIFFVGLLVMNIMGVFLSEPTVVLIMIGLAILFYALLGFYYLQTQRPSLGETVFLSVFLGMIDMVAITTFVYFSGGAESPYFVFYLLVLATGIVSSPYFPQAVFLWAGLAAVLYDAMVLLIMNGALPYYTRNAEIGQLTELFFRQANTTLFMTPAITILFALGVFLVSLVNRRERGLMQGELEEEKALEKKMAGFNQVYWALTHILSLDKMLGEVLEKILQLLDLNSGLIMTCDQYGDKSRQIAHKVPPELTAMFNCQNLKKMEISPANLKGVMINDVLIASVLFKRLVFHDRLVGMMVLFVREGEHTPGAKLNAALDAAADELAAALYYERLLKRGRVE